MAPHDCHQIEKITAMQGELNGLKSAVSNHSQTLYNGGEGVNKKVTIMWNWYQNRVALEKAIIAGLVISGIGSFGSLAMMVYVFVIRSGAVKP